MAGPATATARGDLEIAGPDGSVLRFPAVWLRDNCPCPSCRDPHTGQKLFGICDLPDGTTVSVIGETEDLITVSVAVRRWDEAAKDSSASGPDFGHFRPLLASLIRRHSLSRGNGAAQASGPAGDGSRDSVLTATELCTVKATALPR